MKKPTPGSKLSFKTLLLSQPAMDPPSSTINLNRGVPEIKTMEAAEFGVFILCSNGRSYVVPWSNIRHAEVGE